MTNKEAIARIKEHMLIHKMNEPRAIYISESLDMAIEALEQQPCEDAIRRADAEALFRNARSKLNPSDYKTADEFNTRDLMLLNAEQFIHLLPSVRPQEPKTGHWVKVTNGRGGHECDLCHEYAPSYQSGEEHLSDFCPNCGADMRGEQDE